ncbi:hypothetical protein C1646_758123 [Rhizophagus diaphanus]|nr:hypothetical protein C1646_758123 [Rhizophagus diaphanus] [Rhizophagus sp. MUCL 43196]
MALEDCSYAAEYAFEKSIQLIQNEKQETGTFLMINSIHEDDVYNDSVNICEAETVNIANPHQHKGKERPANKRYLTAIENYSSNTGNDIQEETSNARRKKNK